VVGEVKSSGARRSVGVGPTPYTPHPTSCTLHPTPHTPHPTCYTPHSTPCTLHPTPYTPHPTPYTLRIVPRQNLGTVGGWGLEVGEVTSSGARRSVGVELSKPSTLNPKP
jgi:hypothetical protein